MSDTFEAIVADIEIDPFKLRASRELREVGITYFPAIFLAEWVSHEEDKGGFAELPTGWISSIEQFVDKGMTDEEMTEAVEITFRKKGLAASDAFRYFCGVMWRTTKIRGRAA